MYVYIQVIYLINEILAQINVLHSETQHFFVTSVSPTRDQEGDISVISFIHISFQFSGWTLCTTYQTILI